MKISIEIECTPDEARQFFGLPDVKPMQAAIMQKIETQMTDAVDRFSPDALLGTWMSLVPSGAESFRAMMEGFFKTRSSSIVPSVPAEE